MPKDFIGQCRVLAPYFVILLSTNRLLIKHMPTHKFHTKYKKWLGSSSLMKTSIIIQGSIEFTPLYLLNAFPNISTEFSFPLEERKYLELCSNVSFHSKYIACSLFVLQLRHSIHVYYLTEALYGKKTPRRSNLFHFL